MSQSTRPSAGHPRTDRIRAFVFDLDGTLIDSAPDIARAVGRVLTERGRRPLDLQAVKSMIGDGTQKLLERAFAATGPVLEPDDLTHAVGRFLDLYRAEPGDAEMIYPGVVPTLETLTQRGLKLGVATNKPEQATHEILRRVGLARFFGAVAGGDTLPVRKPDGRHVAWVIERLDVAAADTVMVGDNANDVAAARAAGIPVIAVSYGYPRMAVADLGADAVIDRFADLIAVLDAPESRWPDLR